VVSNSSRAVVAVACLVISWTVAAGGNSPRVNYMLHCQGCHLDGGIGHPGIVPRMQGQIGRFLRTEAGRAYLIQVPGSAQSSLDDAALAGVLNWLLPEFDPANVKPDFRRFTAAEVTLHRATQMDDVSATRRALLAGDD
jgi:hypothetical protein